MIYGACGSWHFNPVDGIRILFSRNSVCLGGVSCESGNFISINCVNHSSFTS